MPKPRMVLFIWPMSVQRCSRSACLSSVSASLDVGMHNFSNRLNGPFWIRLRPRLRDPTCIIKIIHLLGAVTDWMVTLSGVVLILVGGYGMVATSGLDPFGQAQKGTSLPAVPSSGEQKR
jgi:hypothetical protein